MSDDEERRQTERKQEDTRDRDSEDRAKAGDPDERLDELDTALETEEYPTTTNELVEAYGDYDIETQHGTELSKQYLPRRTTKRSTPPTTFEVGYWD